MLLLSFTCKVLTTNGFNFQGFISSATDAGNDTWLALNFNFYDTTGRESALPRLAFNDRSTQFEFIMNQFVPNYTNPRYFSRTLILLFYTVKKCFFSRKCWPSASLIVENETDVNIFTPAIHSELL